MKTLQDCRIVIRPEDNGTFVAYLLAISGCHAWGQTSEEARSELANMFDMIQEKYQEEWRSLLFDVKSVVAHTS